MNLKMARYRHSPSPKPDGYGGFTQMGGCPDCTPNICTCNWCASYDKNGEILIPTYGGSLYWSNDAPPQYIHPISCCFDVYITGFSTKGITQSWFINIEDINGHYRSSAPENCYAVNRVYLNGGDCRTCPIVYTPLCTKENKSSPFSHLISYLVVGIDDPIRLCSAAVHPLGYYPKIYYNDQREIEGRPQLYIWAIAELQINHYWLEECDCFDTYYFKKKIAEFNGDYYISSYGHIFNAPPSLYDTEDDCGIKYYNGDFDGRNIYYTITSSDLWRYEGSPNITSHTYVPVSKDLPEIGNFGSITIQSKNDVVVLDDLTTEDSHYLGGAAPDPLTGDVIVSEDPSMPTYLTATMIGVISTNPMPAESGIRESCDECENLNVQHRLLYSYDGDYYFQKDLDICCLCSNIETVDNDPKNESPYIKSWPSGICINEIIVKTSATRMIMGYPEYGNVIECTIKGIYDDGVITYAGFGGYYDKPPVLLDVVTYKYDFNDWNAIELPHRDFNGMGIEVPFLSQDSRVLSKCDFSNSYLYITFGTGEHIYCSGIPYLCVVCHDRQGPNNVQVEIPDDWVDFPQKCGNTYVICSEGQKNLLRGTYILNRTIGHITINCTPWTQGDHCIWGYSGLIDEPPYYESDCAICNNIPCCIFPYVDVGILKMCEDLVWWETQGVVPIRHTLSTKNKFLVFANIHSYLFHMSYNFTLTTKACIIFGKVIDPADYGLDIRCDPSVLCDSLCLDLDRGRWSYSNDPNILGGQYLDCRFDNLELSYIYSKQYFSWETLQVWTFPIKWGGASLYITSMY